MHRAHARAGPSVQKRPAYAELRAMSRQTPRCATGWLANSAQETPRDPERDSTTRCVAARHELTSATCARTLRRRGLPLGTSDRPRGVPRVSGWLCMAFLLLSGVSLMSPASQPMLESAALSLSEMAMLELLMLAAQLLCTSVFRPYPPVGTVGRGSALPPSQWKEAPEPAPQRCNCRRRGPRTSQAEPF